MNDVVIARLRRIKLPQPHHQQPPRPDGSNGSISAYSPSPDRATAPPPRQVSILGQPEERYVFTKSASARPRTTREGVPTGYKSFFRSLKQKHGFRDNGADSAFNLRIALPEVKRPKNRRRIVPPAAAVASPPSQQRAMATSPSPPHSIHPHPHHHHHHQRSPPRDEDLGHYYVEKLRSRDRASSTAAERLVDVQPPAGQSISPPHTRILEFAPHGGSHYHHSHHHHYGDEPASPINKEAILADIAEVYLGSGQTPHGSPKLHREPSAVNPDVTEDESLSLVGIQDAVDDVDDAHRRAGDEGDDVSTSSSKRSQSREKQRRRSQEAETIKKIELLVSLMGPAVDKLGPWRAWRQWRHYVYSRRDDEFRWGWREVSKEEACFLFHKRYNRLRKGRLRWAFVVWNSIAAQMQRQEHARRVKKAKTIIYRNVYKWYKRVKAEREHQQFLKLQARKQVEMAAVLRFEREAKKIRAIHHYNKAQSMIEHSVATVIQKAARRYLAVKQARVQKDRKMKGEWRYREWRRQCMAECVIRRAYYHCKWRRGFDARVAVRLSNRLRYELEMASASTIQRAWQNLQDRRSAKLMVAMLRIERERHQASRVISKAWHNAMHIRAPLNRRADARHKMRTLQLISAYARLIQSAYRKHHNYAEYLVRRELERVRRKKMPGAATAIACCYRRFMYRQIFELRRQATHHFYRRVIRRFAFQIIRSRLKKRRQAAATTIQLFWYRLRANEEAAARLKERRRQQEEERRRREHLRRVQTGMATRIQRMYRSHFRRLAIHRRVMLRIEAMRPKHEAAVTIQQNYKRYRGNVWLRLRFAERRRLMELARLNRLATIIQTGYRGYRARYYAPSRLIIRRQMEIKRRQDEAARKLKKRNEAAQRIQRWYKKQLAWKYLYGRFRLQKNRLDKGKAIKRQQEMALRIQMAWHRMRGKARLRQRFAVRKAATTIQRAWKKHRSWKFLEGRFMSRRKALDVQYQLAADKEKAQEEEAAAQAAKKAAEDELALKISRSWKLGADAYGRNYYFNWITNESRWDKPEGWEPQPEETWIKNMDDRGNTYYYHILTGESRWLPPCTICYGDAQRFCLDCDLTFCNEHYEDYHEDDDKKNHQWRGADTDKDNLQAGEVFCIECRRKAAKKVCKVCRDPYCERCFENVHRSGWLAGHAWLSYSDAKKGWQVVPGRSAGEPPYYFNATSGESTYEKPRELMGAEELAEHDKFVKARDAAERYVTRIEELQTQLESLQYKVDLKWAEDQEKESEMEDLKAELEELRRQQQNFWDSLMDHVMPWRAYLRNRRAKADALVDYRKKLLISRKDREKLGMVLGEEGKGNKGKKSKNVGATAAGGGGGKGGPK